MRDAIPGESRLELRIPIRPVADDYLYICGIFPLTDAEWQNMINVLEAMRPALVRNGDPDASDS